MYIYNICLFLFLVNYDFTFAVFDKPVDTKPFLAMDLTYIYALLHHGYKLQPEEHVKVSIFIMYFVTRPHRQFFI